MTGYSNWQVSGVLTGSTSSGTVMLPKGYLHTLKGISFSLFNATPTAGSYVYVSGFHDYSKVYDASVSPGMWLRVHHSPVNTDVKYAIRDVDIPIGVPETTWFSIEQVGAGCVCYYHVWGVSEPITQGSQNFPVPVDEITCQPLSKMLGWCS